MAYTMRLSSLYILNVSFRFHIPTSVDTLHQKRQFKNIATIYLTGYYFSILVVSIVALLNY